MPSILLLSKSWKGDNITVRGATIKDKKLFPYVEGDEVRLLMTTELFITNHYYLCLCKKETNH